MAGWLTLTLISAGFPKMTKIALILLFHVLPILSRYRLPNEGLSLREWRLKVNSSKSPVVNASSKTLVVLYKRERERKKWDWERMRKARRGRSWESYSLVADSHMSSRRPGLLRGGGTLFCSHLKWSTCRINFQHPLVSSSACWSLHITLASMCIVPSYRNTWRTSLCLCKRIFSTKKHDGYICWIATFLSEPCLIACPLSSFKLTHSCCWDFDVNTTLAVADIVSGDVWRSWCLVAVCW